jgi:hypothetical protein
MASGTADLQRDLGGAVMQSILGALLTAGYASAFASALASAPSSAQDEVSTQVATELQSSFAGAEQVAEQYPQYSTEIIGAARESFVSGQDWAYLAGVVAMLVGAVMVFFLFPRHEREKELLAEYQAEDSPA